MDRTTSLPAHRVASGCTVEICGVRREVVAAVTFPHRATVTFFFAEGRPVTVGRAYNVEVVLVPFMPDWPVQSSERK